MRKSATDRSPRATLRLVGAGVGERASASSPFGPLKVGLIISQRTNEDQVLTELLNSLERQIADLSIRSCEVLNIFLSDTKHLVKHTSSFSLTDIISICDECGDDLVAEGESKCLECLTNVVIVFNS